jgi:hypothetical protein
MDSVSGQEYECSQVLAAAMTMAPSDSPTCFELRNAEGSEKNTSAVADAMDNVEKRTA